MTYGYIRVSTDKQTTENQRFEISRFAEREGLSVDGWIEETISGVKNYDKRKLGQLLAGVEAGDLIICSELSRLGRSLFMVMEILSLCMQKDCRIWTIKDNYRLGEDIQSKVLAFAFGLSARFPFVPLILIMCGANGEIQLQSGWTSNYISALAIGYPPSLTTEYVERALFPYLCAGYNAYGNSHNFYSYAKKSLDGKTIYLYNEESSGKQFNALNAHYYYVAIG